VTDPVEQAQTEYKGRRTPARAKLAFFQLGQVALELIEPLDGPSTWRDQLEAHDEGVHHIAFAVQGMRDKLASLAGEGMSLIQKGEYTGGRYAYVDSSATLGVILELLEDD
jgi:4-hydroxyphenylpyruvate dioxygenase-like putative hemolysin